MTEPIPAEIIEKAALVLAPAGHSPKCPGVPFPCRCHFQHKRDKARRVIEAIRDDLLDGGQNAGQYAVEFKSHPNADGVRDVKIVPKDTYEWALHDANVWNKVPGNGPAKVVVRNYGPWSWAPVATNDISECVNYQAPQNCIKLLPNSDDWCGICRERDHR